jgi:hypothetical protein
LPELVKKYSILIDIEGIPAFEIITDLASPVADILPFMYD